MRFFALVCMTLSLGPCRPRAQAQEPAVPRIAKDSAAPRQAPARVHPGQPLRALGQSPERAGGARHLQPDRAPLGPFRVGYSRSAPEPGSRSRRKEESRPRHRAARPGHSRSSPTGLPPGTPGRPFSISSRSGGRDGRPHRALKIEPRHYTAWTGLGHILMAADDKARALQAFRRALKINPQIPTCSPSSISLGPEIDGQDL